MLHQGVISKEIQSSREMNVSMMYSLPQLFYLKAIKKAETNVEGCNARTRIARTRIVTACACMNGAIMTSAYVFKRRQEFKDESAVFNTNINFVPP